jgi:hypothetical protein
MLGSNRIGEISELDKLDHLQRLLTLSLSNNPVARKHLYRPTLIVKLAVLRTLDHKDLGDTEREAAEYLFQNGTEQRVPAVHYDQRAPGGKVVL